MAFIFRHGIRSGANILVLGPSGSGKTIIAKAIAEDQKCQLVYVNLAVLERTDFQGLPVLSVAQDTVNYATPEFLPFTDKSQDEAIAKFMQVKEVLSKSKSKDRKELLEMVDKRIEELRVRDDRAKLGAVLPYLTGGDFTAMIKEMKDTTADFDRPIVFLFDEADKAAHEVNQTLLEFLQFRSINGRKLNIQACILTGNLPDEHAHTSQLSHAITKRCQTYHLELDFMQWRKWAMQSGMHEQFIGFLNSNQDMLYQKAIDDDPTCYAMPSPRTWEQASSALKDLEQDKEYHAMSNSDKGDAMRTTIIAGNVGHTAATKFSVWYKHYCKLDPTIDALCDKGKFPDKLSLQDQFVVALSASSKVYASLKPNNEKEIKKIVKNVYSWFDTLDIDVAHGVIRIGFGRDFERVKQYKLAEIEEFTNCFKKITAQFESK